MSMKKVLAVFFSAALVGGVLAGCGGNRAHDLDPHDHAKVGVLAHLNTSEEEFNEIMKKVDETWTGGFSCDYVYYDKLTDMQLGMDSGKIQEMSLYDSVAGYITQKNDKLSVVPHNGLKLSDSFCCAVREDEKELKDAFNKAIQGMKADGTLDKLVEKYITGLKNEDPPAVPMPKIDGAASVKIAVTGDLPPLDLVLADGTAAGFNTAVLAEISNRIGKNIEIVQIESGARASALAAKKVDVVFWVTVPAKDSKIPANIDKPDGLDLTVPYYEDKIVHVKKK